MSRSRQRGQRGRGTDDGGVSDSISRNARKTGLVDRAGECVSRCQGYDNEIHLEACCHACCANSLNINDCTSRCKSVGMKNIHKALTHDDEIQQVYDDEIQLAEDELQQVYNMSSSGDSNFINQMASKSSYDSDYNLDDEILELERELDTEMLLENYTHPSSLKVQGKETQNNNYICFGIVIIIILFITLLFSVMKSM